MKPWAVSFYKSAAWKNCREYVYRRSRGLCELCLKRGLIIPGEIVHHVVELTPENITNPAIATNPENLVLVCRECHAEQHPKERGKNKRYKLDELGRVIYEL